MASRDEIEGQEYFFDEFVLPNYREFLADQLSVRKAYNAAISIAHVPDHYTIGTGGSRGNVGNTKRRFRDASRAFKVVEAMCNAIKHVETVKSDNPKAVRATTTGLTPVDHQYVIWSGEVDGEMHDYRSDSDLLVFECSVDDRRESPPIGWLLYQAMRFVARELNLEYRLGPRDQPDQLRMRYRPSG